MWDKIKGWMFAILGLVVAGASAVAFGQRRVADKAQKKITAGEILDAKEAERQAQATASLKQIDAQVTALEQPTAPTLHSDNEAYLRQQGLIK